jgi:transcriptional regulator with XRE-family HTH domain
VVGDNQSPTLRRVRLARRLRRMREARGLNLDEAARLLDKKRSALHRIESGMTRADVHFVRSAMDIYDQYDADLVELARDAAKPGWWRRYGLDDRGFVPMETEAATELELSLVHIPGLLQTEDYINAVFAGGMEAFTGPRRGSAAPRLYRQRRLTDEDSPIELAAIIDESALRKNIGGPEVMRAQLRHLVRQAELPTVTLQVLPNSRGAHPGLEGEFIVLGFPEAEDPDLLYVAYLTGSVHIEKPEEVTKAKLAFDHLRTVALSPSDSVGFVEQVAREL